jgi:hypothetical protein
VTAALAAFAICLAPGAAAGSGQASPAAPPGTQPAAGPRAALEKVVADYVGLYARPSLDRWKTLFHPSLVVAHPTEDGTIRARGLDEFFKAQKDYFDTGRKISERLENVRIEEGRKIARVGADFVFVDEGQESRGRLGLHLVETKDGWKITAIVFSYDRA